MPSPSANPQSSRQGPEQETEMYCAGLKDFQAATEQATREVLTRAPIGWEAYQATIEVAGKFSAATLRACVTVEGKLSADDRAAIETKESRLNESYRLGLNVMKEVADRCFDSRWHCARGRDEDAAKVRAAGEIALTLAASDTTFPREVLVSAIERKYDYVAERLRKEGIAEEFWGSLVAAAQLGTQDLVISARTSPRLTE